jgi:hypothetical protein
MRSSLLFRIGEYAALSYPVKGGFAIQADAPAVHFVGFDSFGRSLLACVGDAGKLLVLRFAQDDKLWELAAAARALPAMARAMSMLVHSLPF